MSASLTNWIIGAAAIICTVLVQFGAQSLVLRGLRPATRPRR